SWSAATTSNTCAKKIRLHDRHRRPKSGCFFAPQKRFPASAPLLSAVQGYKILYPSHTPIRNEGDRAQGCARPQPAARTCCLRTASTGRKKDVFWLLFGVYQKVARWPQDSGSS